MKREVRCKQKDKSDPLREQEREILVRSPFPSDSNDGLLDLHADEWTIHVHAGGNGVDDVAEDES